ncbi:putative C6 transcription factor [Coniochaeta sp. 2T2.1]|nr:putative C6 transcription factor [Coniochaeta sp. 2T2.1]
MSQKDDYAAADDSYSSDNIGSRKKKKKKRSAQQELLLSGGLPTLTTSTLTAVQLIRTVGYMARDRRERERATAPEQQQQQQPTTTTTTDNSKYTRQAAQATKRYQTLLPAVESSPIPRSLATDPNRKLPPKRKLVLVACTRCRQKKEKCDGERPSCGRCIAKGADCQYEVDDAKVSRTSALKRKCDTLQDENERLRDLFGLLRQKSKPEAHDILSRIRDAENPLAVWRSIKDAELLLPWASSSGGSSGSHNRDPRLEKIDAEAWADSPVRVKARPWTAVAGDGVVSDMVSSFFAWDNGFRFAFVDRECFLADMARGEPEGAMYCSPFLVNAMCAFRCYTSARAKAFSAASGEDLTGRFSSEAKRLLTLEKGRSSLATAQGLVLMFMTSVFDGSDRVGMMWRLMACDMMKQLNLEAELAAIENDASKKVERRALSRALWGYFIFESMLAYTYLQPSLRDPPKIGRAGLEPEPEKVSDIRDLLSMNADEKGKKDSFEFRGQPPLVHGTLGAGCEVASLLYEVMTYNASYDTVPAIADDLEKRRQLYAEVMVFRDSLPANLRPESNFTPQTCLLSVLLNETAISILRPLRRDTIFTIPTTSTDTVKDLFITHCQTTVALLDRYVTTWPLVEYTYTVVCCTNNIVLALVPLLDDPRTHETFTTACRIIDSSGKDFPMSTYVLQGVQALAWAMRVEIPPAATRYLETEAAFEERDLRDLAVALRIPYLDAAGNAAPSGGGRHEEGDGEETKATATAQGAELGVLLARWSAMTIAE